MRTTLFASAFSLLLCILPFSDAALAVPANQITIPDDPNFNMQTGLAYADSEECKREIEAVADRARKACEPFIGKPRVAIVVDVDETILDNREEFRKKDYNVKEDTPLFWDHTSWDNWVREAKIPQIKPTADFVRWAKEKHFAVFVITGRNATQHGATAANLIREGIPFDELLTRPLGFIGRAEDFKTDHRRVIESRGYTIVCSLGDQESDLYGLHAINCEKMPNKMYFVP